MKGIPTHIDPSAMVACLRLLDIAEDLAPDVDADALPVDAGLRFAVRLQAHMDGLIYRYLQAAADAGADTETLVQHLGIWHAMDLAARRDTATYLHVLTDRLDTLYNSWTLAAEVAPLPQFAAVLLVDALQLAGMHTATADGFDPDIPDALDAVADDLTGIASTLRTRAAQARTFHAAVAAD